MNNCMSTKVDNLDEMYKFRKTQTIETDSRINIKSE